MDEELDALLKEAEGKGILDKDPELKALASEYRAKYPSKPSQSPVAAPEASPAPSGLGEGLDALYQASKGPGRNRARAMGIGADTPTQDLAHKTPMFPENRSGEKMTGAVQAVSDFVVRTSPLMQGAKYGIEGVGKIAILGGGVLGSGVEKGAWDYAKLRAADPDLYPARDPLLESVVFSGAPGLDPALAVGMVPGLTMGKRWVDNPLFVPIVGRATQIEQKIAAEAGQTVSEAPSVVKTVGGVPEALPAEVADVAAPTVTSTITPAGAAAPPPSSGVGGAVAGMGGGGPPGVTVTGTPAPYGTPASYPGLFSRLFQGVVSGGEKAVRGGPEFAARAQQFRAELQNVPGLARSAGAELDASFKALATDPTPAYEAIYAQLFHGTPIPDAIKTQYGPALHEVRTALTELADVNQTLQSLEPGVLDEFPVWVKRISKEVAAKRGAGTGPAPALGAVNLREEAYITEASGLPLVDAQQIIEEMDPALRPFQPTAPGMSKGLVEASPDGTLIKWPDTPAGQAGQRAFEDLVNVHRQNDAIFARRNVRLTHKSPIAIEDSDQFIKDFPTVYARSYGVVATRKITEDFLGDIIGMHDQAGNALTHFVPTTEKAPQGFVILEEGNRAWGPLNTPSPAGVRGRWAVRDDVAPYLLEARKQTDDLLATAHGMLDGRARDTTNAPRTGIFNWLWNKTVVEPANGIYPFSSAKTKAAATVKAWEETGIIPDEELKQAMAKGYSVQPPEQGLSAWEDEVTRLQAAAGDKPGSKHDLGMRIWQAATGSPLSKHPVESAIGGGIQGGLKAVAEGQGPLTIAGNTLAGAAQTTVMRGPAQFVRKHFVDSDVTTTVAAFYKHLEDAKKAGLAGEAAIDEAIRRAMPLTQANQWGRVGLTSEVLGGAPGGLMGSGNTGVRGALRLAPRALGQRFVVFPEVATRSALQGLVASPRAAIGTAIGISAYYGLQYGGKEAAIKMKLLTREQADMLLKANPTSIIMPAYDAATNGWKAEVVPAGSVDSPIMSPPTSPKELITNLAGPETQSIYEGIGTAQKLASPSSPGAQSVYGMPLQKVDTDTATPESPVAAYARSLRGRNLSPWAFGGRMYEALASGVEARLGNKGVPEKGAPTWGELIAYPFFGKVKEADPKALTESLSRGYRAEMDKVATEYAIAQGRTKRVTGVPMLDMGVVEGSNKEQNEKIADLAESYLKRGLPESELWKITRRSEARKQGTINFAVKKILIERGVIKPPIPGVKR